MELGFLLAALFTPFVNDIFSKSLESLGLSKLPVLSSVGFPWLLQNRRVWSYFIFSAIALTGYMTVSDMGSNIN